MLGGIERRADPRKIRIRRGYGNRRAAVEQNRRADMVAYLSCSVGRTN
jgi:hypothetical protein